VPANSVYSHLNGLGALRAIRKISEGEEITVDYAAKEKDSLQSATGRNKLFSKHWNFDCSCEVCGADRATKSADTKKREAAWKAYQKLTTPPLLDEDSSLAEIEAERVAATTYINNLNLAALRDYKLAFAYERRAKAYRLMFQNAKDSDDENARLHLNSAHEDSDKALLIVERCFGADHYEIKGMKELDRMIHQLRVENADV
jgi:hypothetical protein